MIDSNIEFVLHSGEKVSVKRPRQVGWGCGDQRYANIDVPQEFSEFCQKYKYQPRYFYVFEWTRAKDGTPTRMFELQRFYMNEIANWFRIPPPPCEIGCDRKADHGGQCKIDPLKLVEAKGVTGHSLSVALSHYLDHLPPADFVRFIRNILGESNIFIPVETLKVVQSAITTQNQLTP